ncbi:MAG: 3-oxo-tetronate 4-phosphate decarboxylase [Pseudomonadota bacterium]
MSEESRLREEICLLGKSLFDRGLTHGATGNLSARLSDDTLLVTPTGHALSRLDPALISKIDKQGQVVSGPKPTKEVPLHQAFYETRNGTGAVAHLHSCHAVALSLMPDIDPEDMLPPLTAYGLMLLGRVKLLPFFLPGDTAIGDAIRGLAGKRSAVMLAHHGPVVAGRDIEAAVNAIEELEASARLALLTRHANPIMLRAEEISALVKKFDIDMG